MPPRPRRLRPSDKSRPAYTFPGTHAYWFGISVIVVASAGVRFACAGGDLWLDEIATLRLLKDIGTPFEILTKFLYDNNHPLNSLFLFLLGPGRSALTYRLLAIAAGTFSVLIAGEVGRRLAHIANSDATKPNANIAGLFTAACVGFSYLLIHYSSEARGYGLAMCFSLLAIYALTKQSPRLWGTAAPLYWIACVMGLLSHVTTFQVMLGGLAWSVAYGLGGRRTWSARFADVAYWHVVPWTVFGLYYALFVSRVALGGGPLTGLWGVLCDLGAYLLGVPAVAGAVAIAILVAVVLTGCTEVRRRSPGIAAFFCFAVLIGPFASTAVEHFTLLFPRYFLISAMCALLLVARALAQLWTSERRALSLVLMILFLAGNSVPTARLIRDGRGTYTQALHYVAAHTTGPAVTIAADNDFRNSTVIEYYAATVSDKTIEFYPAAAVPPSGAEWVFFHRLDNEGPPADRISDRAGHRYLLEKMFPHAALSGWDWYVFHQVH